MTSEKMETSKANNKHDERYLPSYCNPIKRSVGSPATTAAEIKGHSNKSLNTPVYLIKSCNVQRQQPQRRKIVRY